MPLSKANTLAQSILPCILRAHRPEFTPDVLFPHSLAACHHYIGSSNCPHQVSAQHMTYAHTHTHIHTTTHHMMMVDITSQNPKATMTELIICILSLHNKHIQVTQTNVPCGLHIAFLGLHKRST